MAQTVSSIANLFADFVRRSGRWSPPDWVFLPAAGLVTIGLVVLALNIRPGTVEPEVTASTFVMEGEALGQLIPGPGTRFELTFTPAGEVMARLSTTASFEAAGLMSAGVGAALPADWEANAIGRIVRFEVEAQAAQDSRIEQIRLGYFTVGHGDSERTLRPVARSWSTLGICYPVSPDAQPNGTEWLGIWPGDAGDGEAVLVRSIRLTLEPEGETLEQCQARLAQS